MALLQEMLAMDKDVFHSNNSLVFAFKNSSKAKALKQTFHQEQIWSFQFRLSPYFVFRVH